METTDEHADKVRRLARLKNYRTRYELAAVHPDGRRVLVCYSAGKSVRDLCRIVSEAKRIDAILWFVGTDVITFAKRAADGATMGDWRIVWTGRTQREAIIEGELPFVCNLYEAREKGGAPC